MVCVDDQAAIARRVAFQFHGSSSAMRLAGWSGSRASTSASQACGSTLLNLQVSISEYAAAARCPPASEPAKVQFFLPTATQRTARSAALLDRQILPSSRKRVNATLRVRM